MTTARRSARAGVLRAHCLFDKRFDANHGVDTAVHVHLDELTIESPHTDFGEDEMVYTATSVLQLRGMLSSLPEDLTGFVLVDFGSGKGRCLLVASDYPFREIVGVEFAAELHAVAQENINHYRGSRQQCFDISSVHSDATQFQIPDDPCVLYFYNPFEASVMKKVLQNIETSHRENPRKIYIIYCNPLVTDLSADAEFLRRIDLQERGIHRLVPNQHPYVIYESC
jgi:hypothetical protein